MTLTQGQRALARTAGRRHIMSKYSELVGKQQAPRRVVFTGNFGKLADIVDTPHTVYKADTYQKDGSRKLVFTIDGNDDVVYYAPMTMVADFITAATELKQAYPDMLTRDEYFQKALDELEGTTITLTVVESKRGTRYYKVQYS